MANIENLLDMVMLLGPKSLNTQTFAVAFFEII